MSESSHPGASKRPPRQPRKGLTSTGARKAASKTDRSRSREFALQGLYQVLVGKNSLEDVDLFTRDLAFHKRAAGADVGRREKRFGLFDQSQQHRRIQRGFQPD